MSHSAALDSARALHQAGRWQEAEAAYLRLVEREPKNVEALHLLGMLLYSLQRFTEAEPVIRRAIALNARHAYARNMLGMVLGDLGRTSEAIASFRKAIDLDPNLAEAHYSLGIALAHTGDPAGAETCYRRALRLEPNMPGIHCDLADVLVHLGRGDEAQSSYRAALALDPAFGPAHLGLGHLYRMYGHADRAEQHYRQALALEPSSAGAHMHLGLALFEQHRAEEAEQAYRQALRLDARLSEAHAHYADMLKVLGRLDEAEREFRQALEISPGQAALRSDLLLLLNYMPGREATEIYAAHEEFGRRVAGLRDAQWRANPRQPERRLRIGYVSGDLRHHSVAFFIEPVLARHRKEDFEITCYYNHPLPDATTERLRRHADRWRNVYGLCDEALARRIRDDAIDILVDLSGHTGRHRLLAFARKPAPVQATWLGYLNTTGMQAMDWRITDAVATPQGLLDQLHSEALLRLPDSQWCYRAPEQTPEVSPPPMLAQGRCTFGAFTTAAKINVEVLRAWSRLLASAPASRLRIMVNGPVPANYVQRLADEGIDARRVDVLPGVDFDAYLKAHRDVDVMLDTFPYAGGTTTCHCLWMGVPIVTRVGATATSRGGASLLTAAGLPELIGQGSDEYIAIAAALAQDTARLRSLRSTMRERMLSSPLMDAARFTGNMENAYRRMWRDWCARANA